MQNQIMLSLLIPNDRAYNAKELAEMYGVSEDSFKEYVFSQGWLDICSNLSCLTADDVAFLIYQINKSRVIWANKDIVSDIFESEPFTKLHIRCAIGDNSLLARLEKYSEYKIERERKINEVDSMSIELDMAKEDIRLLIQDNSLIKSELNEVGIELSETKAMLARALIKMSDQADIVIQLEAEVAKERQSLNMLGSVYQTVKDNAYDLIENNVKGTTKELLTSMLDTLLEPMNATFRNLLNK